MNAPLIVWDFNKEINVTLEDALFSAKSMAIMFGNGTVRPYNGEHAFIMKTEVFTATATTLPEEAADNNDTVTSGWHSRFTGPDGRTYKKINPKFYDENGEHVTALEVGKKYFCSFDIKVDGSVIEISANSFPGTLTA